MMILITAMTMGDHGEGNRILLKIPTILHPDLLSLQITHLSLQALQVAEPVMQWAKANNPLVPSS